MLKVMQKYNTGRNFWLKLQNFIMNKMFFAKNTLFIINYKKGVYL